jgi:hypothetical protein
MKFCQLLFVAVQQQRSYLCGDRLNEDHSHEPF